MEEVFSRIFGVWELDANIKVQERILTSGEESSHKIKKKIAFFCILLKWVLGIRGSSIIETIK